MTSRIAIEGAYLGQPSSKERLAELLGRTPTPTETRAFRFMRSELGVDPTAEEFREFRKRKALQAAKGGAE